MPIETVLEIVIAVLTVLASIKKLFGKFRNKEIIIKSIIPRLASGFVGREKEIDKIRKYIQENNNIILVSGMGGIGKAEICKKLFHEYKKNKDGQIKHVCWVSWNRNLKKTLIANKNFEKIKEYINGLAGSFLLFIDNMNEVPSEKDRLEIENLGCRTVIISRCERIGDWHVVPIGELSKDECVLVYKENVSRNVYDDNIVRQIVEKANNLTLVVKLLAKMARAARFTDLELLEELNKRGFNLEGVTEKIDEKTFHEHLKKLFDISKINKTEIAILKKFSLFPPMPLNKNKAKEWLEQKDLNNLNILANKSWLIETETGFSMHPVISSVFSEKHPKYKEYSNLVNMLGKSLDMDF
jgi:broad-specificity NMP kinase